MTAIETETPAHSPDRGMIRSLVTRAKAIVGRFSRKPKNQFNLVKSFAVLSLASIAIITFTLAILQSRFLTDEIMKREATISREFIESIAKAEETWSYFVEPEPRHSNRKLESFFNHIANMPDVMDAVIYDGQGTVLWSAEPSQRGKRLLGNHELEAALKGELVYEQGTIGASNKPEHRNFGKESIGKDFVETYVPIWNGDRTKVVGAVELYREPRALQEAVRRGLITVWLGTVAGGSFLFLCLIWIVWRANKIMQTQQQRLIEVEAMAMVGETASAVVHAVRNPISSIRASAELALDDTPESARESAQDIILEVDRLDRWTRDLLQFCNADCDETDAINLGEVVRSSLDEFRTNFDRQNIDVEIEVDQLNPLDVRASPAPMTQVFSSLFTNALQAMPSGGKLAVHVHFEEAARMVVVRVQDSGPGLPKKAIQLALKPFYTTKPNGTGLGLPLARRIIERLGGALDLHSPKSSGLAVSIRLPASASS